MEKEQSIYYDVNFFRTFLPPFETKNGERESLETMDGDRESLETKDRDPESLETKECIRRE